MTPRMQRLFERWQNCTRCRLHATRTCYVHGRGNDVDPLILFVGEAPGREEDASGVPFCGKAGRLLRTAFEAAELIANPRWFITNTVGDWPPGNRVPKPDEIRACRPRLRKILRALPTVRFVMTLGKTAGQAVLPGFGDGMIVNRGKVWQCITIGKRIVRGAATFHPSYLARRGGEKAGEPWNRFVGDLRYVLDRAVGEEKEGVVIQ